MEKKPDASIHYVLNYNTNNLKCLLSNPDKIKIIKQLQSRGEGRGWEEVQGANYII